MKSRLPVLMAIASSLALFQCTENTMPAEYLETTSGLVKDSNGVWMDALTRETFADMPSPFREMHQYCYDCHSHAGRAPKADSARLSLTVDTWKDLQAFGLERYLVAAKIGAMPPEGAPPLPPETLARVESLLASWNRDAK